MKQIGIKGTHPAYTATQLRAVVTWVLRELAISPAESARWTVKVDSRTRREYAGTGGGGRVEMHFTAKPLRAERRAEDLVHLAAHELWHNEQHRRLGYRWERTASGRRKNYEPGARTAEASIVAAFQRDADALLAQWGFERGSWLPALKVVGALSPATAAAVAAADASRREVGGRVVEHLHGGCPGAV